MKWHEITEARGFPADGWLAVGPSRRVVPSLNVIPPPFYKSVADPCGRFHEHLEMFDSMLLLIEVCLRLLRVFCGWVGYDLMVHLAKKPDSKQQHSHIHIYI